MTASAVPVGTKNIYERAIEVLQERGHGKGAYERDDGRVCLLGAIQLACHGTAQPKVHEGPSCYERIRPLLVAVPVAEPNWNDAPERTLEDVILLLKYAAADELETWSKLYGPSG